MRLQIEIEPERHAQAMEQAYKRLAPRVQIRGFRPGKAPRPLIEKQLGRHRLLDEAMDIIIPDAYREALQEQALTPVGQPSVELVSHEPLIFTATVPLQPVVDLGDYRSLRVPREPVTISDEQVEQSLRDLRRRYGTIEPVDRPAQAGDIVRGDLEASLPDRPLLRQDDIEFRLTEESLSMLPGLLEIIVGMKKGDSIETSVQAPEDFSDAALAGKTITYKVMVADVKEEKLAEEDDAFAREVGEGFDSIQALRDRIRSDLQSAAEEEARLAYEVEALDALVQQASIEYPPVLVEHEIDHILDDEANLDPRDRRAQELYLARLGKSEQEVRDSVREEAEKRLRRSLVLSKLAEVEGISVADADVDAEIERLAERTGEQAAAVRQALSAPATRDSLSSRLKTRRTLDRLVEIASGVAGEAAPLQATEAPEAGSEPKRRRAGPRQVEDEPEEEQKASAGA